jgi:protein-disulfide isomerase
VLNTADRMSKDGVNGTPTVYIDGQEQDPNDAPAAAQAVLTAVQ